MSYVPDLCIYHGDCIDGFTAAWVIKRFYPQVFLQAGRYGAAPRGMGEHILLVDFSYPARQIDELLALGAKSITVLDHHKTAEADLLAAYGPQQPFTWEDDPPQGVRVGFDLEKSGARLAWDFCYPNTEPPALVRYVEDRDLWRFHLPASNLINAALATYTQDLRQWDLLAGAAEIAARRPHENVLTLEGAAVVRAHERELSQIVASACRTMRIGGHTVPVANAPFFMASELGNELSIEHPFAATYFDGPDGRKFSLRSREDGIDVSEIARLYGGGGHRHAAGFQRPLGWEGDQS